MTEQPTRRPVLGLTHKRHNCGGEPVAAICGFLPDPAVTHVPRPGSDKWFTVVPEPELSRYQDCVVCASLWEDARASNLTCGRCGERIRP